MIVSTWFAAILVLFSSGPVAAEQSVDQRRGTYLLIDVQLEDAQAEFLDELWPEVRDALAAERDTVGFVMLEDSPPTELRVQITQQQGATRAVELVKEAAAFFGQSSGLRVSAVNVDVNNLKLTITLSEAATATIDKFTMAQTVEILRNRFNEIGPREVAVLPQESDRIVLISFGWETANDAFQLLASRAQLSFNTVVGRTFDAQSDVARGNMLLSSRDEASTFYVLERRPIITGEDFANVQVHFDQNGKPAVQFELSLPAARYFGDYTTENIGNPIAIVLNGEVISAPTIQTPIYGGTGVITGNFTMDEVTSLVKTLQVGALPTRLSILEERMIGPAVNQVIREQ
jgi:preprotein translocase subunit SecD